MSITDQQIALVRHTFAKVASMPDTVAALFYRRLFELDPSLKPMFKGDMTEQGRKLMQVIAFAVRALRDLDAVIPAVKALGRRHVGYGVKPEHYATVGAALLWTLERGLGQDFTPEVQDAWAAVYGLLVQTATEDVYVSALAQPSPETVALAPAL